ncbi:hypothetical protein [Actinosynnema pretiosum]|uniref:hypothetical protein n=1 Tax=Actinosynnema pretiosum TaxID=42197 RepID=UPI0015A6907F|nr:hypothetical protein [Actinosynnema pretiosum]
MVAEPEGPQMTRNEQISRTAIDPTGQHVALDLIISVPDPCTVTTSRAGMPDEVFTGTDLFSCMVNLRERLEQDGLLLCCQGSRPDVHPTGMDRQMGDGRHAHVLSAEAVQQGLTVDIFAPAEPRLVGTLVQQRDHVFAFYGLPKTAQ